MKKGSEVGSRAIRKRIAMQFAKQTARVVQTQGARTGGSGSRPIGTGACIDSTSSTPEGARPAFLLRFGDPSSLFMNNPG